MVKVRDDHPLTLDGSVDIQSWLKRIHRVVPKEKNQQIISSALETVLKAESIWGKESAWSTNSSTLEVGLDIATILIQLNMDAPSLTAAILYRLVREEKISIESVEANFGTEVSYLITGVLGMAVISNIQNPTTDQFLGKQQDQLEKLRKMLISIVDDVRVALIKLAERTCAIRALKYVNPERQNRVAKEIFEIYAPLAHRLGIGYIKWELEDLAFRYLRPQNYKNIANLLDERRVDREESIRKATKKVENALINANINGEVCGRVKHIYSIWRKMCRKGLEFQDLYDIQALRILVDEIKDCYAALGVVHNLWNHIPKEFDDYITNPKQNGYQSLHTAVVGPDGKNLEVQIRTHKMHQEAELGVCAHWLYKGTDTKTHNDSYEEKINWLRQVLEWKEEIGQNSQNDITSGQWKMSVEPDRVYVFTRNNHLVDLPAGSKIVDFAYKIHTEVGNRCRGAKVGGRIVPLTYQLKTGDQVEILTGVNSMPSRDWINSDLGYIRTQRARTKITNWFRKQNREFNIETGRNLLNTELKRLSLHDVNLEKSLPLKNCKTINELYATLGAGDLRLSQVISHIRRTLPVEKINVLKTTQKAQSKTSSDVLLDGLENMMSQLAKCCHPLPGDSILGFITKGRGITIHRSNCDNLAKLIAEDKRKVITASWGQTEDYSYPVSISIIGCNNQELIKNVAATLASHKINVIDINVNNDRNENIVIINMTIEVPNLNRLEIIKNKIKQIDSILEVTRN